MQFTNLFGTITAILTVVSTIMVSLLKCEATDTAAAACKAAFLTPELASYAAAGFGLLTIVLKMLRPGGALHSLFGPTAVVVPASKSGPGTVTKSQVDAR